MSKHPTSDIEPSRNSSLGGNVRNVNHFGAIQYAQICRPSRRIPQFNEKWPSQFDDID
jgi:hypothetical protein